MRSYQAALAATWLMGVVAVLLVLAAADTRLHHGLQLEAVNASRYIHPPLATRESCGISTIAVNKGGLLLSRTLHTTELPLSAMWQLWWRPERPYYQLRMSNIDSRQFRSDTPLRLDALCSK